MENVVRSRLQSVQFGTAQTYKNLTILPLIAPADGAFQYRTLGDALTQGDLVISEVSAGGSVPELLVVNRAHQAVLLIDGEELAGAKQNRVLNTSILLKEVSETKIPVSCTEQGRWAYASRMFSASGNVMAYKIRSKKSRSVHAFLEACGEARSDQGEVWDEISLLQAKAKAHSPTSAMSDVYRAWEEELHKCDEVFQLVPNQVGLFAMMDGQPAGMEFLSLSQAYAKLHAKLVRSYALEVLLDHDHDQPAKPAAPLPEPHQGDAPPAGAAPAAPSNGDPTAVAKAFLETLLAAEEQRFPSIGHGAELRYRFTKPNSAKSVANPPPAASSAPHSIAGSALVHQDEVIHAAFFRLDDAEPPERMASYRHRRRWQLE